MMMMRRHQSHFHKFAKEKSMIVNSLMDLISSLLLFFAEEAVFGMLIIRLYTHDMQKRLNMLKDKQCVV